MRALCSSAGAGRWLGGSVHEVVAADRVGGSGCAGAVGRGLAGGAAAAQVAGTAKTGRHARSRGDVRRGQLQPVVDGTHGARHRDCRRARRSRRHSAAAPEGGPRIRQRRNVIAVASGAGGCGL